MGRRCRPSHGDPSDSTSLAVNGPSLAGVTQRGGRQGAGEGGRGLNGEARGPGPASSAGAHRKALAQIAGAPAIETPDTGGWKGRRGGERASGWPLYLPTLLSPPSLLDLIPSLAWSRHGAVLPPALLTPDTFEPLAPPLWSLGRYPLAFPIIQKPSSSKER